MKTFSIGFEEERYDEAAYARQVAEYLGTDHTEAYIDEKGMFELVESIPKYYDEPLQTVRRSLPCWCRRLPGSG